ncbi:hypothetical protein BP5796_10832 [Coleophoma crateriformis]|uniref:Xylanolytic transcriptional activator regulatory domain-containing protein n=1 Tax=Coleophoma crateriformis TaxID=565419 RepID=A0A3D8QLJ7_9HELO|nr:hypothetical protein BP5796_10832 [Coleophoma crateriformis]
MTNGPLFLGGHFSQDSISYGLLIATSRRLTTMRAAAGYIMQGGATWTSDQPPHPLWIAQLNLILALGCQSYEAKPGEAPPLSDIYHAGEEFFQRAQMFVAVKAFSFSSVGLVQALLLMALYQQSVFRANACWLTIGHTSRMARGLGLHLEVPRSSRLPLPDRELRRRLWWACFCLDRVSTMIFNRPNISSCPMYEAGMEISPQIDDLNIEKELNSPDQMSSLDSFFLHTTRLYCIADEISHHLPNTGVTNIGSSSPEVGRGRTRIIELPGSRMLSYLTTVNQLDQLLLRWRDSLPNSFKFNGDNTDREDDVPASVQRQRNVLHTRFLGLRILLHRQSLLYLLQRSESRPLAHLPSTQWRPLFWETSIESELAAYSKDLTPSPLETTAAQLNAHLFVSSAQQLLELLAPRKSHGEGWWFDFHFSVMSTCGILGAMALARHDLEAVVPDVSSIKLVLTTAFKYIKQFHKHTEEKTMRTLRYLDAWCKFIRFDVTVDDTSVVSHREPAAHGPDSALTHQGPLPGSIHPALDSASNDVNARSFGFSDSAVFDPRNLLLDPGGGNLWSDTGLHF